VLCTKEAADRARKAAFVLLVEMGRSLLRWAEIDDPKGKTYQPPGVPCGE